MHVQRWPDAPHMAVRWQRSWLVRCARQLVDEVRCILTLEVQLAGARTSGASSS